MDHEPDRGWWDRDGAGANSEAYPKPPRVVIAELQAEIGQLREELAIARASERAALAAEAGRATPVIAGWEEMRQAAAERDTLTVVLAAARQMWEKSEAEVKRLRRLMDNLLEPLPDDSPWYRDHKFLANKAYEMASRIGELTAERDTLTARLAEAEKVIEALAPLTAASKASTAPRTPAYEAVIAAYDAYRTHEPEETHHG